MSRMYGGLKPAEVELKGSVARAVAVRCRSISAAASFNRGI